MRTPLSALFVSVFGLSFAAASMAAAQRDDARGALEVGLDHGVAQLREPGQEVIVSGATAALDLRLHAPCGLGGMARVGTTVGRVLTLELDVAPTVRVWLHRRGLRGLELGGGLGASVFWNGWAPRVGVASSLLGGGMMTVQLDYREHGFFVGVGYLARWLPAGSQDGIDTFSFAATLRVGGEVAL